MTTGTAAAAVVLRRLTIGRNSYWTTKTLSTWAPVTSIWMNRGKQARFASSNDSSPGMEVVGDYCNLHLVQSPYPPIAPGPYPPIAEFITQDWASNGGPIRHDKVAILDGTTGETRTFADYQSTMQHVAAALRYEYDIQEDSTVALFSPNHVDYLPISMAVALCGAKLTPINPLYTSRELEIVLQRSKSSVLMVHNSKLDTALAAVKNSVTVKHILVLTNGNDNESLPEGTVSMTSLKQHHKHETMKQTVHAIHHKVESHPYLLPYSSGTTGLPKGVCLTHKNIVTNLLQLEGSEDMGFPMVCIINFDFRYSCETYKLTSHPLHHTYHCFLQNHKLISPLPFFHIYGLVVSLFYCAWKGQQVITMSGRFDLAEFCQLVQDHQPERAHLVPPIILGLAKQPVVTNYDFRSLQQIVSAAAPLAKSIETTAKERLSCEIKQGWGMSELSPIGTMNSDFNSKVGSIGPLSPSTYGKIINEHGISQPPNTIGELLIKGPQVMLGYLDDPERTAECLSDSGWLRTGDVAYYDEDGYFVITDRLKELIKVRCYQVAPAELEALILTHDNVQDVAVIQVPDEESGELPRAYIVLKADEVSQRVGEEDIKAWVKERVAPYKRLDGGVSFVREIPKSASGKILRRILRNQLVAERTSNDAM
jgi:4-coumarate--CoA ligase